MASSKGKSRNQPAKKRVTGRISHSDTRSRVKSVRRKRANTPYRRQPYSSVSIPQLVYQLLTIDKYNQEAKRFPSAERFGAHSGRRMQKSPERQRLSYEAANHRDDSESVQMPVYTTESRPTSIDSFVEATDTANSSASSSANSSVSNVSMAPTTLANSLNSAKALFRKRSLVQLINSYIKAGVEEGKRQAKKYIRKALSFGVRSGYLIPTDRQGNVLRVCPTLDTQSWNWRRADTESRQRRRIARRGGNTRLTTVADRRAMRRGILQNKSFHNADNGRMASKRKYRTQPARNPVRSVITQENSSRKSTSKSLREKSKSKVSAIKNKKINNTMNNKRGQEQNGNDDKNIKKPVNRHYTSNSAKRAENVHEPVEESYKNIRGRDRDQYKSNEDNRGEGEKSIPCQEDGSRMEKRKTDANISDDRIDCRIESRNSDDDDNDKRSEKESGEYDMSDRATREMES